MDGDKEGKVSGLENGEKKGIEGTGGKERRERE